MWKLKKSLQCRSHPHRTFGPEYEAAFWAGLSQRLVDESRGRPASVYDGDDRRYNPHGHLNGAVFLDLLRSQVSVGTMT